MQKRELQELKDAFTKEKDQERKGRLGELLNTMSSKENAEKRKEQKQKLKNERRKAERELVAHGKRPFFLKKCIFVIIFSGRNEIGVDR